MSCHLSCASSSCMGEGFNSCTACPSGSTLYSNACFCDSPWDSNCTLIAGIKPILQSLDSFFLCLFPLLMLLFCLKAKAPIAYRIIAGLQSLSMLIFSNQYYLYFETFFGLKTLYKSNGYYSLGVNRLETISISYAVPAIVLFCSFLVGLFGLYYPVKTFIKEYESYSDYLQDNWYHFFICFYFFAARSMAYYIGLWCSTFSTAISDIIILSIFGLVIGFTVFKTIYDFHKNKLEDGIYEQQLYLYIMLSPLSIAGLPMVKSQFLYLLVYLAPLALLLLIILLNRNYEIFTKAKIFFYLVEIMMPTFAVLFVIVSDTIKSVIVTIAIAVSILLMIIELSILYYSGISLQKSAKVYPQTGDPVQQVKTEQKSNEQQNITQNKASRKASKKASYF